MSCCYSAFELLLLGTWPSAYYQRVDVLSQLLQTATLRLSYCLVRGHMLSPQRGDVLSQLLDHLLCV